MSAQSPDKSLDDYIKANRSKRIKKPALSSKDHSNPHQKQHRPDGQRSNDEKRPFERKPFDESKKRLQNTGPQKQEGPSVLVLNLPSQIKVEEANTLFSQFGKIENESFNDYDYKIIAKYKKNKQRELTIEFHRNEFDYNLIDTAFFERSDFVLMLSLVFDTM